MSGGGRGQGAAPDVCPPTSPSVPSSLRTLTTAAPVAPSPSLASSSSLTASYTSSMNASGRVVAASSAVVGPVTGGGRSSVRSTTPTRTASPPATAAGPSSAALSSSTLPRSAPSSTASSRPSQGRLAAGTVGVAGSSPASSPSSSSSSTSGSSSSLAAPLQSLKALFFKPKRAADSRPLAAFFKADQQLKKLVRELDAFDGSVDAETCVLMVQKLRTSQQTLLNIINAMVDECTAQLRTSASRVEEPPLRSNRGYRVKFPEDVQEDLNQGYYAPLWFNAECLEAGAIMATHEDASEELRQPARLLVNSIKRLRNSIVQYGASSPSSYDRAPGISYHPAVRAALRDFDTAWTTFEELFVRAFVTVRSAVEIEEQQLMCALFSDALQAAKAVGLITQESIDDYDSALMFAIPRLAVVHGILGRNGGLVHVAAYGRGRGGSSASSQQLAIGAAPTPAKLPQDNPSSSLFDFTAPAQMPFLFRTYFTDLEALSQRVLATPMPVLWAACKLLCQDVVDDALDDSGAAESAESASLPGVAQELFTQIAGVADKLQSDANAVHFRAILKTVFKLHEVAPTVPQAPSKPSALAAATSTLASSATAAAPPSPEPEQQYEGRIRSASLLSQRLDHVQAPPVWVSNESSTSCTLCQEPFTMFRRRHHCRNCGSLFCGQCSSNTVHLPQFGFQAAVRVCVTCYSHCSNSQ